jgi:hypothetical protein
MFLYIISNHKDQKESNLSIEQTIHRVASDTNTQDLVVALYLLSGQCNYRGMYLRRWISADTFSTKRGNWVFTSHWKPPVDLPAQFKLIRLRLDPNPRKYPKTERDIYGWIFRYTTFEDHLATLFAHELHHYRKYHLGLHPREGEIKANYWALSQVQSMGFNVDAEYKPVKSKKYHSHSQVPKRFPHLDPFKEFRSIKSGATLKIIKDPRGTYLGEKAIVLRPIRSQSKRIVIQTSDGKTWRWPMHWVKILNKEDSFI